MKTSFSDKIENGNASFLNRNSLTNFVLEHPETMTTLTAIGFDLNNPFHYKAIWIMELLAERNPNLLQPYIETICEKASQYHHESAIRGLSRVVYFMSTATSILLTENQKEKLIEIGLDWLIDDNIKVAPKAYAMYTLLHFAKEYEWIKEELRNSIDKNFHQQSAGYKAAARNVLKKINS